MELRSPRKESRKLSPGEISGKKTKRRVPFLCYQFWVEKDNIIRPRLVGREERVNWRYVFGFPCISPLKCPSHNKIQPQEDKWAGVLWAASLLEQRNNMKKMHSAAVWAAWRGSTPSILSILDEVCSFGRAFSSSYKVINCPLLLCWNVTLQSLNDDCLVQPY